jgi:hypothetical protein
MLIGATACAAPAAETAPSETPASTESEIATPSPTAEPTPTPEPTPEPLTEGQQWYFSWLSSHNRWQLDIYACLMAYRAYENGELDAMIESGEIEKGDIEILNNCNDSYLTGIYKISLDNILYENDVTKLQSSYEAYIKIRKGLSIKSLIIMEVTHEKNVLYIYKLTNCFEWKVVVGKAVFGMEGHALALFVYNFFR